jgi:predicted ribosomally synthesized peptide with SipW-like signal peptide
MRVPLFLLALVAGASASAWSDTDKVSATAFHGPGLIYKGEVWNGDKTARFTTNSYIAKSVITGKDSYYPKTLPATLKTPYLVADSTHPNLAFW